MNRRTNHTLASRQRADTRRASGILSKTRRNESLSVNLFGTPSDERVLHAPNRSQRGPTSECPGWPFRPCAQKTGSIRYVLRVADGFPRTNRDCQDSDLDRLGAGCSHRDCTILVDLDRSVGGIGSYEPRPQGLDQLPPVLPPGRRRRIGVAVRVGCRNDRSRTSVFRQG